MDEIKTPVTTEAKKPIGIDGLNTPQAQAINGIYDAQLNAQKASLEAAHNQALSDAQASQQKIAGQYQSSANDLATQYERNRANFNQQALNNGMNVGAGSQAQLAMNSQYQRDFGNLRMKEAEAQAEAQRGIDNMKMQYQAQIAQATADNDYKRATALLEEYNNNSTRLEATAKQLAATGDFSGYLKYYLSQGYTPEEAQAMVNNMQSYWAAANPDAAYRMGKIDLGTYNAWKNPNGTSGGGGSPKSTTPSTPTAQDIAKIVQEEMKNAANVGGAITAPNGMQYVIDGVAGAEPSGAVISRRITDALKK